MKNLTYVVFSTALAAVLGGPLFAQNIAVVSGNGQLAAPFCTIAIGGGVTAASLITFELMTVKVTDSSNKPVAGATVTWTLTAGNGSFGASSTTTATTTTDASGITSTTFIPTNVATGTYLQNTVTASVSTPASVTFYLTQAALTNPVSCIYSVVPTVTSPVAGTTITGSAGANGSPAIVVNVSAGGTPVPNVAIRLINSQDTAGQSLTPAASCATGAGADPGSVLTDTSGNATCTPALQSSAGTGSVSVLYGGVAVATDANGAQFLGGPLGNWLSSPFPVEVAAAAPSMITIISGNNQSANPGAALPQPLTAQVSALSGGALGSQAVTWSVTPSGAATLSNTSTTSDSSGNVSTVVTLASSAVGTVQVKVALLANPNTSVTFTETATGQVTGLQISGNNQSAAINTQFSSPLTVTVNGASGPVSNAGVQFSITGPGTLSSTSATTNASGQAQVTVTAGATTGAITVTASVGGQSATFNLTVGAAAPSITAANFYNGAGFYPTDSSHSALTPCGITALIAPGVAPAVQGVVAPATFGALPYQVANVSITVAASMAPIYSVSNVNGQQQVNFQVPCNVTPGNSVPVVITVNGASTTVNVIVRETGPGIFDTTMSDGTRQAVIIRPDGSFMDSETNPVRAGEQVTMYVTGIGPTNPPVATNSVPARDASGNPVPTKATSQIFVGVNNAGVLIIAAQVSPDIVGVAEVTFQVPANTPTGTYILSIGINAPDGSATQFTQGSKITVHQ